MLGNGSDSERLPFVLKKLEQTEAVVIELQDEIAELRADLEFHAAHRLIAYKDRISYAVKALPIWSLRKEIYHDGTPEDMLRVIRAARKGE